MANSLLYFQSSFSSFSHANRQKIVNEKNYIGLAYSNALNLITYLLNCASQFICQILAGLNTSIQGYLLLSSLLQPKTPNAKIIFTIRSFQLDMVVLFTDVR